MDRRGWAITLLCSAGGVPHAAAQTSVRTLLEPQATLTRPFNRITGLHELLDGRVVVVDANEQSVTLVDFSKGTVKQLGRSGSGPGEYRFPMRLVRLGGDSIGIEDGGNQRILVITGKGTLGGILSALGSPIAKAAAAFGAPPKAGDRHGRLYALGYSPHAAATSQLGDSAPIERWRLGSLVRDTIAYLPLPPPNERTLPPGEGSHAFQTSAQWAVGADGQLAILHLKPYSVDLIDQGGKRSRGRPIPFQRIPVTEAHKRQWREEQSRPLPVTIMTPRGAAPVAGLRKMPIFEPVQWPAYLPPFLDDALRFAPDGSLWIQRTTATGHPQAFDVIDRRGVRIFRVDAPRNTRLVGFGKSHLYLVRLDTDNQEFLARYSWSP